MSAHETAVGYVESIPAAIAEPELVTALRAGAVEAFNYLIAVYHQPLYRLVYRIVNDPADAADTLQNIFLKVFRGAAHFEGKSSVKTWLYRIAVHEAAHQRRWWRRHKGRETSLELEDEQGTPLGERLTRDEESPLEATLRGERSRRIQRALETVPNRSTRCCCCANWKDLVTTRSPISSKCAWGRSDRAWRGGGRCCGRRCSAIRKPARCCI